MDVIILLMLGSMVIIMACAGLLSWIDSAAGAAISREESRKEPDEKDIRFIRMAASVGSAAVIIISVTMEIAIIANLFVGTWFRSQHALSSVEIRNNRLTATEYDWSWNGHRIIDLLVTSWVSNRVMFQSGDMDVQDQEIARATGAKGVTHYQGDDIAQKLSVMRFGELDGTPVILVPDNCSDPQWDLDEHRTVTCHRVAVVQYQRDGVFPSEKNVASWCTPTCTNEQLVSQIGAEVRQEGPTDPGSSTSPIIMEPGQPAYRGKIVKTPFYKALVKE